MSATDPKPSNMVFHTCVVCDPVSTYLNQYPIIGDKPDDSLQSGPRWRTLRAMRAYSNRPIAKLTAFQASMRWV